MVETIRRANRLFTLRLEFHGYWSLREGDAWRGRVWQKGKTWEICWGFERWTVTGTRERAIEMLMEFVTTK